MQFIWWTITFLISTESSIEMKKISGRYPGKLINTEWPDLLSTAKQKVASFELCLFMIFGQINFPALIICQGPVIFLGNSIFQALEMLIASFSIVREKRAALSFVFKDKS